MGEELGEKVVVGFLVGLVGMVVWVRWPGGAPAEEEYVEGEAWVRKTAEVEQQDEMVQQRRRNVEEDEDMAPERRRTTDIDAPIRRRPKKATAKEEIGPAVECKYCFSVAVEPGLIPEWRITAVIHD